MVTFVCAKRQYESPNNKQLPKEENLNNNQSPQQEKVLYEKKALYEQVSTQPHCF